MNIDIVTIVKWVLIVLITGFITQFGRMMAQYSIRWIRERRSKEILPGTADRMGQSPEAEAGLLEHRHNLLEMEREKERLKQEKKLKKAIIKAEKKR